MPVVPVLVQERHAKPAFFPAGQWFAGQVVEIPRDVARHTQFLAVGQGSQVGAFLAQASNGSGRVIPFSTDRPIVGNLCEALGGIDSDILVTQPNWWAYGSRKFGVAGITTDLELLFPAEIIAYPYIPPSFDPRRATFNDSWVPGAGNLNNVGYDCVAVMPCHNRKSVALGLKNNSGGDLFWYVDFNMSYVSRDSGFAGNPGLAPVVDPYVVNSPNPPVVVNTLSNGNSDSRFFTNLAGQYMRVMARAVAGGIAYAGGNYQFVWEVRD